MRECRRIEKAIGQERINEEVKRKVEAIGFYKRYSLSATVEAYKISRSTLYRRQKAYKEYGEIGLVEGSRAPLRKRGSKISSEVKEFVLRYRIKYGRIHGNEIKKHLDEYCSEAGIETVSNTSIGRIIRELKEKGMLDSGVRYRLNGRSGKMSVVKANRNKEKNRLSKGYVAKAAGDIVQVDSVHCFKEGIKKYILTACDVRSRFCFSYEYDRLNSINGKDFMEKLIRVSPYKIEKVQTDNGLEFEGYFDAYLRDKNIKHFYNYPRSPKSNAYVERFNRTLREQFIDRYEGDIKDTSQTNKKLIDYLLWYNGERGHQSLNYNTPLNFAVSSLNFTTKKSYMLRDSTII
jgi:transposase InsO family protein